MFPYYYRTSRIVIFIKRIMVNIPLFLYYPFKRSIRFPY
nr:MAG TPA: protein of unknown function (DUF1788) [Caudoviricetes sp.]